ncbi:helix-turn-helix transcriptional regulator [Pseudomonas sp. SCB32]|uniref:helix-turn-helix transcriptional regulator n=1 Tax=Pseudomonas sp. SCB32 TaxID=2653853 RepID=UPI0015B45258|nr:helix-turn-helix transcriptional regulator [Pseudomonas sp. SCB32]
MHGTAISLDDLSDLIDLIYEGATEPLPWQQSLERLREALGASYATLILRPTRPDAPGFMVNAGAVSTWAVDAYEGTFYALDPLIDLPQGELHTVTEILGEDGWRASAFYQQFNAPLDIFHILGADIPGPDGGQCRLRISRSHGAPAFDAADKAFCARLLSHLQRALSLYGQLERSEVERRLYATAVERMRIGTLILDSRQQVLESNQAAQELLAAGDGLQLLDGCLQASVVRDNQALQRLISEARQQRQPNGPQVAEAIMLTRPSGRPALGVVVQSLRPNREQTEGGEARVAVFLRDPEQTASVPQQPLRQLFGFTPTEAELAAQLANGLSLEDACVRMSISRNTAKSHLRAIFAKAGVNRQSELACTLHASVAFLCGNQPAN